jgi:hypothetical protein
LAGADSVNISQFGVRLKRLFGVQAIPGWLLLGWKILGALSTAVFTASLTSRIWTFLTSPLGNLVTILLGFAWLLAVVMRPRSESWTEKLANEDSIDMNKKLILCGTSTAPYMDRAEPYVDVTFRIVNASAFPVMASGSPEGNAIYIGYSGVRHPLRTPELTEALILNHAEVGNLKVRQFMPLTFTDNIAAGGGKIRIDFSLVKIRFRSPLTRPFIWFGDEVEVTFPRLTQNSN